MSARSATLLILTVLIMFALLVPTVQAAPQAPSDLQVQVGKDYVDLWWRSSGNATHYLVYRGSGADDMETVANVTAPITAYHDGDLEDGSTFIYYVCAVDGDGESAPSSSVAATVPAKGSEDIMLPILALVLSTIAIQVCVVMLLYFFKMNVKRK